MHYKGFHIRSVECEMYVRCNLEFAGNKSQIIVSKNTKKPLAHAFMASLQLGYLAIHFLSELFAK